MIVIIPSIRELNDDFLGPLLNTEHRIIVVDDSGEERIRSLHDNVQILTYADRRRMLGPLENCIPQKNGACRDFGLLVAYWEAEEDEVIVCLDDDCQVFSSYAAEAIASLGYKESLPLAKTQHRFYNLLDLYQTPQQVFPRGFPYEERGREVDYDYSGTISGNVVFNLALWQGVFDVNAIDKLYLDQFDFPDASLRQPLTVVQPGALASLCSMNMIMTRDVIPAIYQLPMNEPAIPHWNVDRYGDIWGGYICKKLIDRHGNLLAVGEPMIYHHKAGNQNRNMMQEHYSHIVCLPFCELLDEAMEGVSPADYLTMYDELVTNLEGMADRIPFSLKEYMTPTIRKMRNWVFACGKRALPENPSSDSATSTKR